MLTAREPRPSRPLLALAVLSLALAWPEVGSAAPPAAATGRALYWYCPNCHFEMAYEPWQRKRLLPCPNCKDRFLQIETSSHAHPAVGGHLDWRLLAGAALAGAMVIVYGIRRRQGGSSAGPSQPRNEAIPEPSAGH